MHQELTNKYKQVVINQTTHLWTHIERMGEAIPDDIDWATITDDQRKTIKNIISIEREWITDDEAWREVSMFQFSDGSDDDDEADDMVGG